MAGTENGQLLEKAYGNYTDMFRTIVQANFSAAFLKYYDPNNLDPLLGSIWSLHNKYEKQYQTVTEKFFHAYRQNETGKMNAPLFVQDTNTYQSVITTFMIHGPQAIKKKEALLGKPFQDFNDFQRSQSVAGVSQQMVFKALEAPRDNMMKTIAADKECKQWIRKADSGACNFCMMLVSRGPVYKASTSKFQAHSNCGCVSVPVYKNYKLDDESLKKASQWISDNNGKENKSRREANNADDVKAGLKRKKEETFIDKNGRESTRTVYVDTEKGKAAKKAAIKKAKEPLEKLKRDGDFKEPAMSDDHKRMTDAQTKKALDELSNPATGGTTKVQQKYLNAKMR
jgi:hypothetical protein